MPDCEWDCERTGRHHCPTYRSYDNPDYEKNWEKAEMDNPVLNDDDIRYIKMIQDKADAFDRIMREYKQTNIWDLPDKLFVLLESFRSWDYPVDNGTSHSCDGGKECRENDCGNAEAGIS